MSSISSNQKDPPSAAAAATTGGASSMVTATTNTNNNMQLFNWEPIRQRLTGSDLKVALDAANELIAKLESGVITPSSEFPLMLSALLPAFSSVLTSHRTSSSGSGSTDNNDTEAALRAAVLEWMGKLLPAAASDHHATLRPHAPHLVAVAMDVLLQQDVEPNGVAASRILFDLYKTYRTLPSDYVQPYLDFVIGLYRQLPVSVQQNFSKSALTAVVVKAAVASSPAVESKETKTTEADAMDIDDKKEEATATSTPKAATTSESTTDAQQQQSTEEAPSPELSLGTVSSSTTQQHQRPLLKSNASFKVLTECPLIVMLMFQLYPKFMKTNIPILIKVMMEALALRPPAFQTVFGKDTENIPSESKRAYFSRARELVAAQAKTLSFLTYLLRTFSAELQPYQDQLAKNVIALMSTCPRESISTRKELLVATRHLLNSDFRAGFFRHVDPMLDERVLMGGSSVTSSHRSDPSLIRPLAYTTLSDFVQHVRTLLSMTQMSRVVCLFSRVLHDASLTLPLTTQYTAVRTLLSVVDLIFHNKDPNPQIGRDMLVRLLDTLVDKLQALTDYFPAVVRAERKRELEEAESRKVWAAKASAAAVAVGEDAMQVDGEEDDKPRKTPSSLLRNHNTPPDSVRDVQSMIRAIIVGHKTVIYYIANYRTQRMELAAAKEPPGSPPIPPPSIPAGSNEEVSSAMLKITNTEIALIDKYVLTAIPAMKLLTDEASRKVIEDEQVGSATSTSHPPPASEPSSSNQIVGGIAKPPSGEKTLSDQHRDALTYFGAAFAALDGYNLRKSLGRRLDILVDAIVDDPMVMVVPRHLLGSNKNTSYEFCNVLLDYLVERMDRLGYPMASDIIFFDDKPDNETNAQKYLQDQLQKVSQLPAESEERQRQRNTTMLQLFERVLKSLSPYPENEVVVRRHLRRIVVVCLRSSMENVCKWPESYCMLLRYVFRSISAGKFEESYKELLPLIPTVLNGLYRVITSSEDSLLRCTAIELCLTIPARLSSLLPHMNLLLRIIIPALDSNTGDLVNLGLRTLEFWVDNLNPLYLYPECSKQTELFSCLMQALSRHLRPAPYPYGLLTLRLLGKLGGKNRQFLREPMQICEPKGLCDLSQISIECFWKKDENGMDIEGDTSSPVSFRLPLSRCLEILKMVALAPLKKGNSDTSATPKGLCLTRNQISRIWDCKIEKLNLEAYSEEVIEATKRDQSTACFGVIRTAAETVYDKREPVASAESDENVRKTRHDFGSPDCGVADEKRIVTGLLYSCMIDSIKEEALDLLKHVVSHVENSVLCPTLALFLSEPSIRAVNVGLEFVDFLLDSKNKQDQIDEFFDVLVRSLCEQCCLSSWSRQEGLQRAICRLVTALGSKWGRKHEGKLINASLLPIKTVPRELSIAAMRGIRAFIRLCSLLYGSHWTDTENEDKLVWDMLSSHEMLIQNGLLEKTESTNEKVEASDERKTLHVRPSEDVFRILVYELASPQQLMRFAARFLLQHFVAGPVTEETKADSIVSSNLALIRRVLFSRMLRLLPLPQQVGVIEGLTSIIRQFPGVIPLGDQHLISCLSEVLKLASVADGDMDDNDNKLDKLVVDKDGYAKSSEKVTRKHSQYPSHASSLFFRRECVIECVGAKVVVPAELPAAIQLRVSAIVLFQTVVQTYTDTFFDALSTAPIGNVRPHVVSLLFRSLVASPPQVVDAAHSALRDILSLSVAPKTADSEEGSKSQSRLPKELLQTCIRPVLLNLREYTKLSVPLLRGLSRLLSLLSSWFNKTLGEKLIDHLQKWTDPATIMALNIWKEGEEPLVASAIVGIFASLPHASHFVEHLVKTCIKLEATLPAFKAHFVESPYRRPLARYLNRHTQYAVSFFFPRLKTPMYSELFQDMLQFEESRALRKFLSNKQCSVMILNVCFERPLAIIRSEKSGSTGTGSSTKTSLYTHGVAKQPAGSVDSTLPRPMNTEALELQHQGFRLVNTLLANDPDYFRNHNDVVRAFRWLWRSKGRFLRLQHEDIVPPRYHEESRILASFLMSYAKSFRNEDLDILFELFRVFLQPSTSDFAFVSRFLTEMVARVLSTEQKRKVVQRFFVSIAGDTNEEIKVLGIQFLVFPMLAADAQRTDRDASKTKTPTSNEKEGESSVTDNPTTEDGPVEASLMDSGVIEKFVRTVMFQEGNPISCGDRLKVELLRLSNLFVEYNPGVVAVYRKEMMKFCWSLLKSEDMSCKCWAYVVVCRFISAFDTIMVKQGTKIVQQVYVALLRCHQQEGRELVRAALDLLVPVLPKRLSAEEFQNAVEQTSQMMLEEGNSTPQVAHFFHTVVRNPEIFRSHSSRFVPYMINSLSRLGLPPNSPQDNRILAIDVVELLLLWEKSESGPSVILDDHAETMSNFVVRLKLLLAEASLDVKNVVKPDAASVSLGKRITKVFDGVLSNWNPTIRTAPFEKLVSKDVQTSGPLLACLELLSVVAKFRSNEFFSQNSSLVQDIVAAAFEHAREDSKLQTELRNFVSQAKGVSALVPCLLVALEKIIEEARSEQKKATASGRAQDSNRSRSREKSGDENTVAASYGLYALELIDELCEYNPANLNAVAGSLLSFATVLSKMHLMDAAAKQRQGSSSSPRSSAPGNRYHTPTIGILEGACSDDNATGAKLALGKQRLGKGDVLSPSLRSLVVILSIFESSELLYFFTQNRKTLFHVISGIVETSDNAQILMIAVRMIGKWIIADSVGSPLTPKEKSSLLARLSAFDFTSVSDDIAAQPLMDLISILVQRLNACPNKTRDEELGKLTVACLLNADLTTRNELLTLYLQRRNGEVDANDENVAVSRGVTTGLLWRLLHSDFEGLSGRFWIVVFVNVLMRPLVSENSKCVECLQTLVHGDSSLCQQMFEALLPSAWDEIPNDALRVRLIASMEALMSRPYHCQLLRTRSKWSGTRCLNSVRSLLNAVLLLRPIPVLDTHLLISLAENYNCWHEVLSLLEQLHHVVKKEYGTETVAPAMRHIYRQLHEESIWLDLAGKSCKLEQSNRAISFDLYGLAEDAVNEYANLIDLVEAPGSQVEPTSFEMDLWEERWIMLQREMCQSEIVSDFAKSSQNPRLQLECAWKSQDWAKVRSLCSSTALLAAVENGDPIVKMSETLLAVADGKLSDVENLHAQTAQLCLYKWQLLPQLASGSMAHSSLLHFFHRLVEIRESGQIMVETSNHSNGRTLPDLKNLLNAWRHRLPNDYEKISTWDEVFSWRTHMFKAIMSNFHWSEPDALAALHDRPWTAIRMAKTARKQGMRDVALLLLNRAVEDSPMNVSDAFLKLREQILAYYNPDSDLERHGGLNLINSTNLSFFDTSQKSELFRLKAMFLHSLQGRGKANQEFCHSVQICPTHARAWDSWGELCTSLSETAEKQLEEGSKSGDGSETASTESKAANAKNVPKYLAQAMGCYLEAIMISCHEFARIHIPKCLWMLTKDGPAPGLLSQTFENHGSQLPAWIWLPWIPQLLSSLYRREGRAVKSILARVAKAYPQAAYYPLRAYYLERRDVDRLKSPSSSSSSSQPGQHQGSVTHAEELMSLLRRSHASLWSSLESVLEELIVKFRPAYEEELLATILVLIERAETQSGGNGKKEGEESAALSVWKTLGRIAVKYFRPSDSSTARRDIRAKKTAEFKEQYKALFEADFHVSATEPEPSADDRPDLSIADIIEKLKRWKLTLENHVLTTPTELSVVDSSFPLAMFGVGDAPDLWPGSCDPRHASPWTSPRESTFDTDPGTTQSTTSSSAAAARKAANSAASAAAAAATKEGAGGDYGGGSSYIEIPGQYAPNTSAWSDTRPSPELHAKLLKFEPTVEVIQRNDSLVRRVGMVASDGRTYAFILQFAVPYQTRTDERTAQTHYILDKVLRKDIRSSRAQLSVQPHPVIPVAQRLRLISEPATRRSLEDVQRLVYRGSKSDLSVLSKRFNDDVQTLLNEKSSENLGDEESLQVEKSVRLEVYSKMCLSEGVHDSLLSNHLLSVLDGPEPLYHFRRMFAQQWAANSLLQYAFSAADRSPAKVVFVESNGRVLAPEFRIAYTGQGGLSTQPIPFRLTPNVSTLIGFPLLDARFIPSLGMIASAIESCKDDIDPIFNLLMRDDLVAFYTKSLAKSDAKTVEMEKQLAEVVKRNVSTLHSRIAECAPSKKAHGENAEGPIDQRVRDLVEKARSPENLCMMTGSFQGWL